MPRCCRRLALVAILCLTPAAFSADPPNNIDRVLALQTAIADARELLTANKPDAAIDILEKQLPNADGNRAFLHLLRSAYAADVKKLLLVNGDPKRVTELRTKLALLGATVETEEETKTPVSDASQKRVQEEPKPTPTFDLLSQAAALFSQGKNEPQKFDLADRLYAAAFANQVQMNSDQHAAWAFCKVRLAATRLAQPGVSPQVAAEVAAEVEEALKQAPQHAELQKIGRQLIAAARQKTEGEKGRRGEEERKQEGETGWQVIETASFKVWHRSAVTVAESVARAAEARRAEIFTRWSGPAGGAWEPKCDIYIHPDAASFATATRQPQAATGCALVSLDAGRPTTRRIDLRADDDAVAEDALPRELTHIVLADLFPTKAPPRWAIEGMAVLAATPAEVDRYLRTAAKCRKSGESIPATSLLDLTAPPADKVTGFYVGSVAVVEFLVRWKGEKAFTTFLRDGQRYGATAALQRQYGLDPRQLDEAVTRGATAARGQAE